MREALSPEEEEPGEVVWLHHGASENLAALRLRPRDPPKKKLREAKDLLILYRYLRESTTSILKLYMGKRLKATDVEAHPMSSSPSTMPEPKIFIMIAATRSPSLQKGQNKKQHNLSITKKERKIKRNKLFSAVFNGFPWLKRLFASTPAV